MRKLFSRPWRAPPLAFSGCFFLPLQKYGRLSCVLCGRGLDYRSLRWNHARTTEQTNRTNNNNSSSTRRAISHIIYRRPRHGDYIQQYMKRLELLRIHMTSYAVCLHSLRCCLCVCVTEEGSFCPLALRILVSGALYEILKRPHFPPKNSLPRLGTNVLLKLLWKRAGKSLQPRSLASSRSAQGAHQSCLAIDTETKAMVRAFIDSNPTGWKRSPHQAERHLIRSR